MTTEDDISSTESVLVIFNVQPEDSGEYLCTAWYRQCLGSQTNATMLTVVSPPEFGVFIILLLHITFRTIDNFFHLGVLNLKGRNDLLGHGITTYTLDHGLITIRKFIKMAILRSSVHTK